MLKLQGRTRTIAASVAALLVVLLLIDVYSALHARQNATVIAQPTATATAKPTVTVQPTATLPPLASCAEGIPGATSINLGSALSNPVPFPANTVGGKTTLLLSGKGLFSVYGLNLCTPNTSVDAVSSFFESPLAAAWWETHTFPFDGAMLQSCDQPCFMYPGTTGEYLVIDQIADRGHGIVTYHVRYATFNQFPTCGSKFSTESQSGGSC